MAATPRTPRTPRSPKGTKVELKEELLDLKASKLRDICKDFSKPCADALEQQGIDGEAMQALLEKSTDKSCDLLLNILPDSIPMGEKLVFIGRLQDRFAEDVSPIMKSLKKRPAAKLLPLAIIGYLLYCFFTIATQKPEEPESVQYTTDATAIGHMFSWLGWSPEPGTACYQAMTDNFPGAMPSQAIVERTKESLQTFGLGAGNTIYAEATCSDEINHEPHRLGSLFTKVWGSVFTMGGIGGFPFGGQAALGAFSGHVPDGGNMFILYGPHVGISEAGEIGMTLRGGQHKCTTACGALMGVYKNVLNNLTVDAYPKLDAQARFIHEALAARVEEIKRSSSPEAMLPKVAFDVAHDQMMHMADNMALGSGYLVLLGGIQINTPDYMQDQFVPMHFSIRSKFKPQKDLASSFDMSQMDTFLAQRLSDLK